MSTATITTWLLTYLAHSTILLGATWLATRFLGNHRLALQEILLRTALVGGLLTATLQVGLGVEPVGGSLAIADLSAADVVASSEDTTASINAGKTTFSPTPATPRPHREIWLVVLLSLWGLGSILALMVLGRSMLDLRRLLKTRRGRPPGRRLDRRAGAMGLRRTVRLSTTAAIAVPFATGIRKPEICCPERVGDLAFDHQKSLFAHELAHLARRDPAWQLLYRIGEALLFLQPLNRIVRRRLEEIAEHLTDERAVACTGDRLGLARCLVVVAHWGISDVPGAPATAFAAGPRLDRRVRHLISGAVGQHRVARWTAPVLAVLVAGSVLVLPAIAPSPVHADLSRTGAVEAPARTWSTASDDPNAKPPAAPKPPAVPPSSDVPRPVPPVTDPAPAPYVVPLSPAEPRAATAPEAPGTSAPSTAPESRAEPAPPVPPDSPNPPPKTDKAEPAEPGKSGCGEARDEERDRQRAIQREQSEAAREARERERVFANQARELAREAAERSRLTEEQREEMRRRIAELHTEARKLAREAAERPRLTDDEREKLWDATRELRRRAEAEAREHSRLAAERLRLTEAQREEIRRRYAELYTEARELARESSREARAQSREFAERARRLAEEAEAERQREKERRERNEE